MANDLPLTISMGPLPPNQAWTPQELADAIAARLKIQTQQTLALFVAGTTEPTSDQGPWWKDNATWYRWNPGTGTYVPQLLESGSLGYWIGEAAPDSSIYQFWIQTEADLRPIALKTYYSGAWTDVYSFELGNYLTAADAAATYLSIAAFNSAIANYYTKAETDAAIAAAFGQSYPAQGVTGGTQSVSVDGTADKVQLSIAAINPAPAPFDTAQNRYVAPAAGNYMVSATCQVDNDSGDAATMRIGLSLYKNGSYAGNALGDLDNTPSPNGDQWSPSFSGMITLAQNDYLELFVTATASPLAGAVDVTVAQMSVHRVSS